MAYRYNRINWQNKPNVATPISAENLNKMDKGIDDNDKAIGDLVQLNTLNKSSLVSAVNELNNNLANKLVNGTLQVGVDTTLNIAINKVYLLSIMSSAENYVGYYLICRTGSAIVISPLKASKDLIINTGTNTISISHPQYALAYRLFLLE